MSRRAIALAALFVTACTAADTGTFEIALTGHGPSGATYRLRRAELVVTGAGLTRVLHTESNPDLAELSTRLPPGSYTLGVSSGWSLERSAPGGAFEPVVAVMTSPNPASFAISAGDDTRVTLRFLAGADDVPLDDGELDIDIDIDEVDAGAAADAAVPPDATVDAAPAIGLGPWTGRDHVAPSQSPPFGLPVAQVPQFVVLGFEDNAYSGLPGSGATGGMSWLLDTVRSRRNRDGSPAKLSFYHATAYIATWVAESPVYVKRAWRMARDEGHEIGNHTHNHTTSASTPRGVWSTEIDTAAGWLTRPFNPGEPPASPDPSAGIGASLAELYGFRAPYLDYNDAMLVEVNARTNAWYDSSIQEGFQLEHDGTNFFWPYTLDDGSPGHQAQPDRAPIASHPGLWEIPAYVVIAPPDERCAEYGIPSGFRARLKALRSWFDADSGKITGTDYDLWFTFRMTGPEFLATLKYTLDQRLLGNRAPFVFATHSDYYSSRWNPAIPASLAVRQAALADLIDYAVSKPAVRVTSAKAMLDWIRNPSLP